MQVAEILKKYDFETLFTELCDLIPDLSAKRQEISDVYDFLMQQIPVASKKKVTYTLIEDDESFDCFVGAEDKCFEANWNVILGKEVCRAEDIEISDFEIAVNTLLCIMLIGFAPKRFLEFQQELIQMM